MRRFQAARLLALSVFLAGAAARGDGLVGVAKVWLPRFETNLTQNIVPFWSLKTIDRTNGGYLLNHDIQGRLKGGGSKMIVTQARQLWMFSHLARTGRGGAECLEAADHGYRFLKDKMWDHQHGGFLWETDQTGARILRPKKHLYGQAFGLYALSEYYLASRKPDALELATNLFHLMEAKAHDATNGGYVEWFNADWSAPPPGEVTYMGEPDYKLMNTHLHLLEAMTTFYRASKLPLARERLLELIRIQSTTVVRKNLGACTDKFERDWTPVLTGKYARVSYGHDLENIWLLADACDAAEISNAPLLDLYRALFDYSLKYGFDKRQGGFFDSGGFNQSASNREKTWWVQAEALVSSLTMYRVTRDAKYLDVFQKTADWIDKHQVDWKSGEWFETIMPDGTPRGAKAHIWKCGYHNSRAMMECIEMLKAGRN